MMKKIVSFIVILLTLVACTDDFSKSEKVAPIVVEGYIENNKLAKVFLTFPFSLNDEIGETTYKNYINSYAKVVVSSDTESEILTLKRDDNLVPPFYYSTSLMTGKAGKTYHLEVIYYGDTITAVTTIPPEPIVIDCLWSEEIKNDTLHRNIFLSFEKLSSTQTNYYRFYTQTQNQKIYYPIKSATYCDETLGQTITVGVMGGAENMLDTCTTPYFSIGDTVKVKASVIDAGAGTFWKQFNNETSFNNPFSNGSNLPSNVKGGLGVWTGMNSVQKQIIIK